MRLVKAHALATEVKEKIEGIPGVLRVELAGSLRRMRETVANIDIIASADDGAGVIEKFTALAFIKEVLGRTENSARILTQSGMRTDLLVAEPGCYGSVASEPYGLPFP